MVGHEGRVSGRCDEYVREPRKRRRLEEVDWQRLMCRFKRRYLLRTEEGAVLKDLKWTAKLVKVAMKLIVEGGWTQKKIV